MSKDRTSPTPRLAAALAAYEAARTKRLAVLEETVKRQREQILSLRGQLARSFRDRIPKEAAE